MTLHASGTNYKSLDEVKRLSAQRARQTLEHATNFKMLGWDLLEWTCGESIQLYCNDEKDIVMGPMLEGLGTKNIIAENEELRMHCGRTFYDAIAWCNSAMSFNDAIALGALPIAFGVHPAVADGDHLLGQRGIDLANGTAEACEFAGTFYGPGETPGLPDIILPGTMCLSGAGIAQVPGGMTNVINPENLQPGDKIFMLESTGVHANGFTAIRKNIDKLPSRYLTEIPGGGTFGEALLAPTQIYVPFIRRCQELGVRFSYAAHISGHGWAKLLRAKRELRYLIKKVPPIPTLFRFIQELLGYNNRKMFSAYNMGWGFALYVRPDQAPLLQKVAREFCMLMAEVGEVQEGPRSVYIEELDITFTPEDVDIR